MAFARNYSSVELFGRAVNLGHLFYPIAIFWLVGFINAVNLVDGADGVASTFGVFFFVSAGIIGLIQGRGYEPAALFSFVMAASFLGFFLCNRPPARVYLGDTGSMLIGFLAGILLLNVCSVNRNTIRFFPAFAIAFLPICDSFLAIVRRKLTGRSIYFADRSHLHHRIQTRIGRGYILLAVLSALQIPLCLGGIAGIYYHNDWIPLGGVLFILVATGLFGRDELVIIARAFRKFLGRLAEKNEKKPIRNRLSRSTAIGSRSGIRFRCKRRKSPAPSFCWILIFRSLRRNISPSRGRRLPMTETVPTNAKS